MRRQLSRDVELVPKARSLTLQAADQHQLPEPVELAGDKARVAYLEFFAATIRNPNTRAAYLRAVKLFFAWCAERGIGLDDLEPFVVAAYIEQHPGAKPTVKQHLAAIRMLFNYFVEKQVMSSNPATVVRGPKHVVKKGKTPVLTREAAKTLIEGIESDKIIGLRDRALLGVLLYSFARVGAVTKMNVADYYHVGRRSFLRLHEKGGKDHEVPAHHLVQEYLDAYLDASDQHRTPKAALFQSVNRHRQLTGRSLFTRDVARLIERRARSVGISARITPHSFRATGITLYLENGGTLEHAQAIAAHESPRTTKLYDRTSDKLSLDEIERISL